MGSPFARFWMFTCQDTTWTPIKRPEIRYLIMQLEKSPETLKEHLQGYVEFNKQVRRTAALKLLELNCWIEPREYTQEEAINYCSKKDTRINPDSEPYIIGEPSNSGPKGGAPKKLKSSISKQQEPYFKAMSEDLNYEQSLQLIKRKAPRDYFLYHNNIESALKKLKTEVIEWKPRYLQYNWIIQPDLKIWLDNEYIKDERCKCLILVSPTRWGKTEWARHLKPYNHIYCRGNFNLDKWRDDAELLILDDIPWDSIPQKKSLLTQMGESDITDKYRSKRVIHVNMPAIILLNECPDFKDEKDYWCENSTTVILNNKLY